ncbi:RNA polymerase II assessory factor Cdc73p [Phaffia rhodozyma]|uniref:RNA polymerase II assessory factor Cdc73p n=1 Tax=Phaffia rhodozyma TaxID=264483 RepID=A0A0F7SNE1_PHARH|nr:RNA polymerase II assessory factor Cdc73p [Phaffia rhodozyma]
MSDASPAVHLRRAILAQTPITLSNSAGSSVASLATASRIHLGPDQSFEKIGAFESVPPAAHPSTINLPILYVVWQTRDSTLSEYLREARANGVSFIPSEKRKPTIDWLNGEGAETEEAKASTETESATTTVGGQSINSSTGQAPSASSLAKRKYVPDRSDVDAVVKIQQTEILLINRSTPLRSTTLTLTSSPTMASTTGKLPVGGGTKKDFSYLRQTVFSDRIKKMREALAGSNGAAGAANGKSGIPASAGGGALGAKKTKNQHPIIVISSSPTSLITMWNVKRFLEEGVFESSKDARDRASAEGQVKAEDLLVVLRTMPSSGKEGDKKMKYLVVEGPEALQKLGNRDEVWSRVQCVLTTGQTWQFAQYKWTDPKQLFHHVKGIYFHWSNIAPNAAVKEWNVTTLQVDPHKRHVDKALVGQFWRTLDLFRPSGGR